MTGPKTRPPTSMTAISDMVFIRLFTSGLMRLGIRPPFLLGNGISHQVHLERFGRPGTTLLGSDSHTPELWRTRYACHRGRAVGPSRGKIGTYFGKSGVFDEVGHPIVYASRSPTAGFVPADSASGLRLIAPKTPEGGPDCAFSAVF